MMFACAPYFLLQWLRGRAIEARRRDRTWRYVAWSAVAGLANGLAIVFAVSFIALFWVAQLYIIAIALAIVLVIPPAAAALIRLVLVPAGWTRAAYHTALYSRVGADPAAFALCVAAWSSRSGESVVWVEAMRDRRKPLGDGEIAATALLAANRGDPATARALLRSLAMIVEDHPAVRELAGEWLACDAAERGAWRELIGDNHGPATPLGYLLEGIAARHLGAAGAPSPRELWGRWLIAPRRRATLPLVREALAAVPPAPSETAAALDGSATDGSTAAPLAAAIAGQLAFETQPATAARLASTAGAWDAALADEATRTWLARRALELDAPLGAVDRAIADVAAAVTDDLTRLAEAAQLGAPASAAGPVGDGLVRRLRHGRLDNLEAGFRRWAEHRHGAAHPPIDEWREFVALWSAYTAAVTAGGIDLRRLAFPQAFTQSSHMAAWLWNKREQHIISHAISKWLLAEALVVGDTEAIELGHRNCALSVPTRLGRVEP